MNITPQELKQIEEWRTTILKCLKEKDTIALYRLTELADMAESAARLFAASYAKDLLADGFPRQNCYFWNDMEKVVDRIERIMSEATVIQATQDKAIKASHRKRHLPRSETLTNEFVAGLYNHCAKPLIRRRLANGKVEYEPQRGGQRTGYVVFGSCSVSTLKNWIKKYPNASKVHEHNGFHAGLLTDKDGIEKSVQRWKKYVDEYVGQFEAWRKIHTNAKRSDFRFKKYTTIHRNDW